MTADPAAGASGTRSGVPWADSERRDAFEAWLAPLVASHGLRPPTLRPASADASFRRYLTAAPA
jgi:hypothetical protein